MLVLSRKVGERILVGDQITITVVRLTNGGVRLGIEAPGDLTVVREEVLKEDRSVTAGKLSSESKSAAR
ncbi:MAG: carbon storage regulator [Planctomycetaceae bacterium]|nr:carbon storage regulator [Planctomycetaceae bacterium]